MKPLVLASASQYRRQLLQKLNLEFITCPANIDESPLPSESAGKQAVRLAQNKAEALKQTYPHHLIIGSDQVAVHNGRRLSKPGNRENCIRQLSAQSGHSIAYYTGLCVLDSSNQKRFTELDTTTVLFRTLSQAQIKTYVDQEKPYECAGGFRSEGLGIALFQSICSEDPNALIGLPLIKLIEILKKFEVHIL